MKRIFSILLIILVTGCAGLQRGCSSWNAESFGADWIVIKESTDGQIMKCWQLHNTSITNEDHSDGIYWVDGTSRHLVHISGWYDRVQVTNNDFTGAAKLLGVDLAKCGNGIYPTDSK